MHANCDKRFNDAFEHLTRSIAMRNEDLDSFKQKFMKPGVSVISVLGGFMEEAIDVECNLELMMRMHKVMEHCAPNGVAAVRAGLESLRDMWMNDLINNVYRHRSTSEVSNMVSAAKVAATANMLNGSAFCGNSVSAPKMIAMLAD